MESSIMLRLREAEISDMDKLFEWANDPLTRMNSFHPDFIDYNKHKTWFKGMMSDNKNKQFIMMDDDKAVGQIRVFFDGDRAEIGYSIDKEYRGNGYGKIMIDLLKEILTDRYPQIKKLTAKVKPENIASMKTFEREEFELEYLNYTLDLRKTLI